MKVFYGPAGIKDIRVLTSDGFKNRIRLKQGENEIPEHIFQALKDIPIYKQLVAQDFVRSYRTPQEKEKVYEELFKQSTTNTKNAVVEKSKPDAVKKIEDGEDPKPTRAEKAKTK